ncbi:MAG: DUF951 domain-containing protein [Thermomicrobiales bacterium]|nr:DUF951 domain-containing protein [Thermomicrobiales bacterium]
MSSAKPYQPLPFAIGDVVRLKKPHPCGSYEWTVTRLGADIGLKCHGCERRVLLTRREAERRFRGWVSKASPDSELAPVSAVTDAP